jgi:hypothetical protein
LDDLEFHEGVLVRLKLTFRMSSVADCIPIAERQTKHGIVTCFGLRCLKRVGQLRGKLDQMRETEDLQWGGTGLLNRYDVKCAKSINQEDKAQDDSDDVKSLSLNEQSHQVINEIQNECGDKQ